MIGEVINEKYKIETAISESHMYEVFEALEVATGATVIVKILKEEMAVNTERVRVFSEEIRAFASISHPSVAEILDIDMFEDRPFVVTELVTGRDLHYWIKEQTLAFADCVKILQDLTAVLQYASDEEVFNRTIKLSNVLRTEDGKLTILSFTHPRLKLAGKAFRSEKSGVHSDLFFLGTTFFELLAGETPIRKRGGINELWDMKLAKHLRIRHSALTPAQIESIVNFVRKTLTREMKQRFASHEEFLKSLADLAGTVRGSSIKKKERQLSMASQVIDAINGRMSNINPIMPTSNQPKPKSTNSAMACLKGELDKKDELENNPLVDGNLALSADVAKETDLAEKEVERHLKVIETKIEQPKVTVSNSAKELWNSNDEVHWLRNPVLFMGSCLIIMILLILFW